MMTKWWQWQWVWWWWWLQWAWHWQRCQWAWWWGRWQWPVQAHLYCNANAARQSNSTHLFSRLLCKSLCSAVFSLLRFANSPNSSFISAAASAMCFAAIFCVLAQFPPHTILKQIPWKCSTFPWKCTIFSLKCQNFPPECTISQLKWTVFAFCLCPSIYATYM